MSTDSTLRDELVASLHEKEYRDAFVADQIRIGVPLQIKKLRDDRELSQEALGGLTQPPMKQESVWRLENPNRANVTINTLLRVASAFDVALMVRFVPFSELIDSTPWLSSRSASVPEYAKDTALHGHTVTMSQDEPSRDLPDGRPTTARTSGPVVIDAVNRFRLSDSELQRVA